MKQVIDGVEYIDLSDLGDCYELAILENMEEGNSKLLVYLEQGII
jgi:hypothetical protein